jgi:16S rRNA (cytosine1402-N4)-methyltransferase
MNHISVFKKEIIENLGIKPYGTYADLTLGAGGHSLEIWNRLESGTLVSFDVDANSLQNFVSTSGLECRDLGKGIWEIETKNQKPETQRSWFLVNRNFNNLKHTLSEIEIEGVNGIIADLGWSTDQLETIQGLSHQKSAPLDMRLDQNLQVSARDLLNGLYRKELMEIFESYADIVGKQLMRLVEKIIEFRKTKPFETTDDLMQVIDALASASFRGTRGRTQDTGNLPARVFQALRIAVNTELSTLQSGLTQALEVLLAGGSLEVITFHSGEDRVVKKLFHTWVVEAKASNLFATEFLQPSVAELQSNLRSRSAKLRGIRKSDLKA